jgi:hypothetical protein
MPMRPSLRFALCGFVALASGGCTLVSQIGGSSVVAGDERGGTVSRVTTFTQAGALNMASAWCGQYGLLAQQVQIIFATDSMDFACVPQPAYQPQPLFRPPV